MSRNKRTTARGQVVAGGIVLAIGLALLLTQLGLVPPADLGDLWPLLVIAVGLSRLIGAPDGETRKGGYLLTFFGAWFLINTLEIGGLSWEDSWPLALVSVGLAKTLAGSELERPGGIFLIVLGLIFQSLVLEVFGVGLEEAWPMLLVLGGAWIIFRAFQPARRRGGSRKGDDYGAR